MAGKSSEPERSSPSRLDVVVDGGDRRAPIAFAIMNATGPIPELPAWSRKSTQRNQLVVCVEDGGERRRPNFWGPRVRSSALR
jgi:hypothetical protein